MGKVHPISRRKAIRCIGMSSMAIATLQTPFVVREANAIWMTLLRFLLRGAIRSRTLRNVQNAVRFVRGAKRLANAMGSFGSLGAEGLHQRLTSVAALQNDGVETGDILMAGQAVHHLCNKMNAGAIWVGGEQNTFDIKGHNPQNRIHEGPLLISFRSLISGKQSTYDYGYLRVYPKEEFTFTLQTPEQITERILHIEGQVELASPVSIETSKPIIIASPEEVQFNA